MAVQLMVPEGKKMSKLTFWLRGNFWAAIIGMKKPK